jgi:hypothetical protein
LKEFYFGGLKPPQNVKIVKKKKKYNDGKMQRRINHLHKLLIQHYQFVHYTVSSIHLKSNNTNSNTFTESSTSLLTPTPWRITGPLLVAHINIPLVYSTF